MTRPGSTIAALPVGRALTPEQVRSLRAAWDAKVDRICRATGLKRDRFGDPMLTVIESAVAAANGSAGVAPQQLLRALGDQLEHLMPQGATTYELGIAFGAAMALASEWEAF